MFVNMNIDIICHKLCIYGNMLMYMIIQMIVVLVWPILLLLSYVLILLCAIPKYKYILVKAAFQAFIRFPIKL